MTASARLSEAKWNITTHVWWFISFYYFYWLWWWLDSRAHQTGGWGFHKCHLVWFGLEINHFNISIRVQNSHYWQSSSVTHYRAKHFLWQIFYEQKSLFLKQIAVLKWYECDSAYWWSRQHSGMQVSGWGLNMEWTKDDCILKQMDTGWGGEVKNEEVLWTRPDPESVSRASSFTFHPKVDIEFWEWNNAQRKGKIRVWERERIKQREDDQEQTDRNRAREKVQAFRPCLLHAKHCTSVSLYRLCTWNEESMTLCGKSTLFKHVATLQNDCISKYMK